MISEMEQNSNLKVGIHMDVFNYIKTEISSLFPYEEDSERLYEYIADSSLISLNVNFLNLKSSFRN